MCRSLPMILHAVSATSLCLMLESSSKRLCGDIKTNSNTRPTSDYTMSCPMRCGCWILNRHACLRCLPTLFGLAPDNRELLWSGPKPLPGYERLGVLTLSFVNSQVDLLHIFIQQETAFLSAYDLWSLAKALHLKIPALKKLLRSHVRPLHIFQNSNSNPLSLRTEKIEKKIIENVEELTLTSKRWADFDSNSESSEDI